MRAFDHIHRLSIAEHNEQRRGALVARVTSDIETLAQFMEWGAVAWIVDSVLIVATFVVMVVYDWRLALVTLACFAPLPLLLPTLQRRQLAAHDRRTAVGETLSEVSETITGAPVIQAYGLEGRARSRLGAAIDRQYRAYLLAARYFAAIFPLGDLFGSVALAGVIAAGVTWGPGWGLGVGEVVAFTFLIGPAAHAHRGAVRDHRPDPDRHRRLAQGAGRAGDAARRPRARARRGAARGRAGRGGRGPELRLPRRPAGAAGRERRLPAGRSVAVVGETGSGKTTFAKLLCRLADPTEGTVRLGGVDLRSVAPGHRRRAVRLVPQDGFLFDATIADNVRIGAGSGAPAAPGPPRRRRRAGRLRTR